jgi:D-cysteine desulfhydrase family pyridoxal phosphate-dependent enzyme
MSTPNSPIPKVNLGCFPTPVVTLSRLSAILGGPEILMKRDDLSGLALGGNKTRKLEYILAEAKAQGCDTVITGGAAQSNHCRQTAAAAAAMQLECHLVLGGREPDVLNGNLLLDSVLGSHIHWAGPNRKGEDIPEICKMLKTLGKRPYIVPYGGSNELGAYSFVRASAELERQTDVERLSHIVVASSSGGTHAGLIVAKAVQKRAYRIVGIKVDQDQQGERSLHEIIVDLVSATCRLMACDIAIRADEIILDESYVGNGYGVVGNREKEAITLTARSEGILLDPVYTGRAMGGLIEMIRSGQLTSQDTVLFWHTGGAPALFAYAQTLTT